MKTLQLQFISAPELYVFLYKTDLIDLFYLNWFYFLEFI